VSGDGLANIKARVRKQAGYAPPGISARVKLNQNESPFELPQAIKEELLGRVASLEWRRYPDPTYAELRAKIREYAGIESADAMVGTGSNGFIMTVMAVTVDPGTKVIVPQPSFSLYEEAAEIMGADIRTVKLGEDFSYDADAFITAAEGIDRGVLVICAPNNPTGSNMPVDEIERMVSGTGCLVLLDEAYQEFADDNAGRLLDKYDNLIILRTFSKVFGLAGLRVGYMLGRPEVISEVSKGQMPYNLSFLSAEITMALLDRTELIAERVEHVRRERVRMVEAMMAIEGIHPYPTAANFILFNTGRDAGEVARGLLDLGVMVRDVSGYPYLSGHLRVTVGETDENDAFIDALNQVMTAT
jgi:histidinol-phosphate aminotransferase